MRTSCRVLWLLPSALALAVWSAPGEAQESWLLVPDRVYDGTNMHEGWSVLVPQSSDWLTGGVASQAGSPI